MSALARRAKAGIYRLAGLPLAWLAMQAMRLSGARLGVAVLYHRIGDPAGDAARELVPALGSTVFGRQVRFMSSCFRLVPASELLSAVPARRRGERFPAAITFDDDDAGYRTTAVPILQAAEAPATFFLNGASLEHPFAFWWDRLRVALDRGLASEAVLGFAVPPGDQGRPDVWEINREVVGMSPDDRDAFARRLEAAVGPDPADAGMRAEDVRALVDSGFEVGFHTRRHYMLPVLDDDRLSAELHEGVAELRAVTGRPLDTIAYPYGAFDDRVAHSAAEAGFAVGFTTEPRAVGEHDDPLLVPRIEAPFASAGHFALRVARAVGSAVLRRAG